MKSLISEIVKIQLVRELLSEGRVEDAKAKFPQDADVIDYFVSQDPSGNNKYLNWEMKVYKQLPPEAPADLKERHKELIANLIKGFHQHAPRLQMRDINQYKTLGDLNTAVSPLIKASEEKAAAKLQQEEGSRKLYEDSDWLMLIPLTHQASCKYGANTQWCVASRDTNTHFKSYTREGLLIFLIHKKSNNKFAFYQDLKFEGDWVEIYNPIDNDISWYYGIDGSVENFLKGLVKGKLETYLQDDYDDGDEEEFEITFNTRTGQRQRWAYDEDDLADTLISIVMEHYLGRGSGRNSFQKYKDVLRVFGLTLELEGKTQASPFTIKDETGEFSFTNNNRPFNGFARNGGINNMLENYLFDRYEESDYVEFVEWLRGKVSPNGLNIEIVGPGFNDNDKKKGESKNVDPNNIMSNDQYKGILKVYESYLNITKEEIKARQKEAVDKIMNSLTLEGYEKFDTCANMDTIYNSLQSLPNTKTTLVQLLRHRGQLKGRLPRNWPKAEQRLPLNAANTRYIVNVCMREVAGNVHPANIQVKSRIETKTGKERVVTKTLSTIYSELDREGVIIENGYEGLLRMLIDREKAKQKNP